MIIEDKFVISAPIQEVWDFFLDIPAIGPCLPGAEQIEQVDDENYKGNLVVKVGPIKANFNMQVALTDLEPPHRLAAKAQGKDKNTASMVSATFTASLTETEPGQTEVAHHVDVAIRGRLGQFGQGVIRETAKQITQVFATCVQAKLTAPSRQEGSPVISSDGIHSAKAAESTAASMEQLKQPSLITIFLKAILTTIREWFQSLKSASTKVVD